MNALRFLRKCITDRPAAWRSAKLVARLLYGKMYWTLRSNAPIRHRISSGGTVLLYPQHSFTQCLWPAVESYEPDVRAALLHFLKPGDTFLDCGANVGYFSVMAGHLVGPKGTVVAIEANPDTQPLLEENLRLNGFGKMVCCALSRVTGDVELFMPPAGDVYSSLRPGGLVSDRDARRFRVPSRTLDEVVSQLDVPRVDLVKLDVEGCEIDVLEASPRVMCELRPLIICEYGTNTWPAFGASKEKLHILLEKWDYNAGVFSPESKSVYPVNEAFWQSPYANLILFPLERSELRS